MNAIVNTTLKTASFTTTKSGKKLSKKAATAQNLPEGTRVGQDVVSVKLSHVNSYNDLIVADLAKLKAVDAQALFSALAEIADFDFTDADLSDALNGDVRGRKGIITSLTQTLNNENPDNEHLDVYEPHPSGWGKIHTQTLEIHISGIISEYAVLERDENRPAPVNSGVIVKLKNLISKHLDLSTSKWRQFKLPENAEIIFS